MSSRTYNIDEDVAQQKVRSREVFTANDLLFFAVLSVLRVFVVAWFLVHWLLPVEWWRGEAPMFVAATLLLGMGVIGNHLRWAGLLAMRRPVTMKPLKNFRVAAVTTCVPDVEPPEMMAATLQALVSLDCAHDTWLLDEGDSAEMRELCRSLGVRHFSRRSMPFYQTESGCFASRTKHGNYNAWLHEIGFENYDILFAFDADQVPIAQYASAVLGYFEDPQIGYVQAPQVYRNQGASLVAQGAAEETYAYYSVTEMASYGMGQPVLTGCHSVHRLAALEEYGGFPDHTAEDLLQTINYRIRGWRGVYVPEVLATGLAPEAWSGYLNQQVRWARSVLDIKFRRLFASSKPFWSSSSMAWLQGFGYMQDALMAAGVLLWFLVWMSAGVGQKTYAHLATTHLAILLGVLIASDLFRQRFYLQPGKEVGLHWRAGLLRLAKWPFVWKAFWLVLRNQPFAYVVTPKTKASSKRWRLLLPHGAVAFLAALAWGIGVFTGNVRNGSIHVVAALIVMLSLTLILAEAVDGYS
jgi:cellulose synthase (UDP-forming)